MSEEVKTNQITLTAEQLVNIVGHAATQEQLDGVRRELDTKIDRVHRELDTKIEKLDTKIESTAKELNAKIDSVRTELKGDIAKIDNRLWWIAGLIVALAFKTEILAFFQ